ncbi:GNVR domain-containing protein [Comamonas terrigena]|uniref:GNVR domain-containing protein n=1 Tax=Comamonas terrigena TaxID=32013 RepID=UPI00244B20DE|nr:GNVR domain-containing protein [Comamonas terrigena]MDH1700771.1 Wzz/FepE/Etk N-terminal domain-containing protein [Comamonas terrigena]
MSGANKNPSILERGEYEASALFGLIWRRKLLIAGVALVFTSLAALYAFTAKPSYRVVSVLRPVQVKELDLLNRSKIYSLTPEAALQSVGATLNSYDARMLFYKENPELFKIFERVGDTPEQSFERFNSNSLKVSEVGRASGVPPSLFLEFVYPESVDGVQIINRFVDFTLRRENERLAMDFEAALKNRIVELEKYIDSSRSIYAEEKESKIANLEEGDKIRVAQLQDELAALRQQLRLLRKDRIAQLSEAIAIAHSLGIKRPTTPSAMGEPDSRGGSSIRAEVNGQPLPLYFLGTNALEAERSALNARSSDDFGDGRVSQIFKELQMLQRNRQVEALKQRTNEDRYLEDIEEERKELLRLNSLSIDISKLRLADIDRRAVRPDAPVKPQKALIIILGAMLGIILGFGVVLVREFSRNHNTAVREVDLHN